MPHDVAHHEWFIEQREIDRQVARRGRVHAYEQLDPRTTALVVVDVVPFFVEESAYVRGIVPTINRLATRLRGLGGTVAWVAPRTQPPTAASREFYGDRVAAVGGNRAVPCGGEQADRALVRVWVPDGESRDAVDDWLGTHEGYGVPLEGRDVGRPAHAAM